jgi:hypothetical protein
MTFSISTLFTLIIVLLVLGLLLWLAFYILDQFPLPAPFNRVIRVVLVVLAVLILVVFLLNLAGIGGGIKLNSWLHHPVVTTLKA